MRSEKNAQHSLIVW